MGENLTEVYFGYQFKLVVEKFYIGQICCETKFDVKHRSEFYLDFSMQALECLKLKYFGPGV